MGSLRVVVRVLPALLLAALLALELPGVNAAQSEARLALPGDDPRANGWVTVMSETFEGPWPNIWYLKDVAGSGEYLWSADPYKPFSGTKSGWPVGGGANGYPPGSSYPGNQETFMMYGPFSLADATAARLVFQLWMNIRQNTDKFMVGSSVDANGFNFAQFSGNSNGWTEVILDLGDIDGESVLGAPEVWVMFLFDSGSGTPTQPGLFIDNILIEKETGAAPTCYTLTKTANPVSGGTVSASPPPNCNDGTQYTSGTTVQLTAAASSGYIFSGWSSGASGTSNPTSVTMDSNKTVVANFTQCFSLTTGVDPAGSGTVSTSPAPNCAGGRYTSGTVVQLTAHPAARYAFQNWSGSAAGSTNPVNVTLSANRSVTANFIRMNYSFFLPVVLRAAR